MSKEMKAQVKQCNRVTLLLCGAGETTKLSPLHFRALLFKFPRCTRFVLQPLKKEFPVLISVLLFLNLLCPELANATQPLKPGELKGGTELSLLGPTTDRDRSSTLSDQIRIGVFTTQFIPFSLSLDIGCLNSNRQRFTRANLFGFGWQPSIDKDQNFGGYGRIEALSLIWRQGAGVQYRPGIEAGAVFRITENLGLTAFAQTLFSEASSNSSGSSSLNPNIDFQLGIGLVQWSWAK